MAINLGPFPVALLMFALLIPIGYSLKNNRKNLKPILLITIASIVMIVLYPVVSFLAGAIPDFGYSIGKIILFILLPAATILYIEKWGIKDIFRNLGVRKTNLPRSVLYGIIAGIITITITIFVSTTTQFDAVFRTVMFFEAFTEEFFFRGFLFLYLLTKTNLKVAYATSIVGFILIHPQNFTSLFIASTMAQSVLNTIIAHKTRNIIGPWISHGMNRLFPPLIRVFLGM